MRLDAGTRVVRQRLVFPAFPVGGESLEELAARLRASGQNVLRVDPDYVAADDPTMRGAVILAELEL